MKSNPMMMTSKKVLLAFFYTISALVYVDCEFQTRTTHTGTSRSLVGNDAKWQSIENAQCNAPSSAYSFVFSSSKSDALDLFNFSFSIPENASVTDIVVNWTVSLDVNPIGGCREYRVSVFTNTSEFTTVADTNWTWMAIPNRVISYPLLAEDQLWGRNDSWTAEDINSYAFGASLAVINGQENVIAIVECCHITVTYNFNDRSSSYTTDSSTIITLSSNASKSTSPMHTTTTTTTTTTSTQETSTRSTSVYNSTSSRSTNSSSESLENIETLGSYNLLGLTILLVIISLLLILFIVTGSLLCSLQCKNGRSRGISHAQLSTINAFDSLSTSPSGEKKQLWLENIEIKMQLGKGNFGTVFMGEWDKTTLVACKTITGPKSGDIEIEARVLQSLKHPNVITYFGLYHEGHIQYMITEYLSKGSLLDYFKDQIVSEERLLRLSISASSGARYLQSRNVIHRDLAARNLLVTEIDGYLSIKICDVGLSRFVKDNEDYVSTGTKTAPLRWSAPEVLVSSLYSIKSDVWSFGVVLWEIFSFGRTVPYDGKDNYDVYQGVVNGKLRLTSPESCPNEIYAIMMICWDTDRELRPEFEEIHQALMAYSQSMGHTDVLEEVILTDEGELRPRPLDMDPDKTSKDEDEDQGSFYL